MLFGRDYDRWFFNVILRVVFIYFSDTVTLVLTTGLLIRIGGLSIIARFTLTSSSQIGTEIIAKIFQSSNFVGVH